MMAITLTSALVALGACGVAAYWRGACLAALRDMRGWQKAAHEWFEDAELLSEELSTILAKRSRAASIARQAQIDRQRALRDNATAALRQGRAL